MMLRARRKLKKGDDLVDRKTSFEEERWKWCWKKKEIIDRDRETVYIRYELYVIPYTLYV